MTTVMEADSMLVIDVGSVTTRAILFDVVDNRYRFIASGRASTTAAAPYRNIGEGVRQALDRLQKITGRELIGSDEQLIIPAGSSGQGVDRFAATISAGEPLKIVVIGLLEDISLESAHHLARTTYARIMQTISLNDRRSADARLNLLMRTRPDLIVAAGGTDGGASQSVLKLLEAVGLAGYLLTPDQRPEVLFAGNVELKDEIESTLGGLVPLHFAANLRPALDQEQLDAPQVEVAKIYTQIQTRRVGGVDELTRWSGGNLAPTATAFGRMVRFLSKAHATRKGVLGIDLGASAATIAAAYDGELSLSVFPQFGLGSGLVDFLEQENLGEMLRWLPIEISESDLRDYILNKAIYPGSLPATPEELAIEQTLARRLMYHSVRAARSSFPGSVRAHSDGLLPGFEPIIATGSVLSQAPSLAHSALMMLDGLQPTGITTMVLDQNHIVSALGAAAPANPTLVVQVVDSNSLLHLGTVITSVAHVRPGSPVLRLKLTYDDGGREAGLEVKQGSLEVLPLAAGQMAKLQLTPLHRADVGMGAPGRGGGLRVMGGALGVIIDARGRPLAMPDDLGRRAEMIKKWLWNLGGQ